MLSGILQRPTSVVLLVCYLLEARCGSVRLVLVQTLNRDVRRVARTGTWGDTGLLGERTVTSQVPSNILGSAAVLSTGRGQPFA